MYWISYLKRSIEFATLPSLSGYHASQAVTENYFLGSGAEIANTSPEMALLLSAIHFGCPMGTATPLSLQSVVHRSTATAERNLNTLSPTKYLDRFTKDNAFVELRISLIARSPPGKVMTQYPVWLVRKL